MTPALARELFVGCINRHGYRHLSLDNRQQQAHRLIWLIVHGEWPKVIDHINGDPSDNRIANLRSVSDSENARNKSQYANNTSGFRGVSWVKAEGRWQVHISISGKKTSLGRFDDFEAAKAARLTAEQQHGYHPNHGRASQNEAA